MWYALRLLFSIIAHSSSDDHELNHKLKGMTSVVLIPWDSSQPMASHKICGAGGGDSSADTTLISRQDFEATVKSLIDQEYFLETPLLRPRSDCPGLIAYYNTPEQAGSSSSEGGKTTENVRATRLAMACGLLRLRFYGNVLLIRSSAGRWHDLDINSLYGACCVSPDLRLSMIQSELLVDTEDGEPPPPIPEWLADAARQNYHDGAAVAQLAKVMTSASDDSDDSSSENDTSDGGQSEECAIRDENNKENNCRTSSEFVAKSPLCLHCRGPTSNLCEGCQGAYFCNSEENNCRSISWAHSCQCQSWRVYTDHRVQLSTFDFSSDWHSELMGRSFQIGEESYEKFLVENIGIDPKACKSWWRTELGGWAGGSSDSATLVDPTIRKTYVDGFAPISSCQIPPETRPTKEDITRATISRNSIGFLSLKSWDDYYNLRGIPSSSPVALLCTFPLTIYHAIANYGHVPVTVARLLKRPLRVHVVGTEKELNFLDLFKEAGFLAPDDFEVSTDSC